MRRVLFVLLVAAGSLASFKARFALDPMHEREMLMDMAYLPSGKLEWFSGGMDDVLSDILWLRSLRYVSDHFGSDRDFRFLYKTYDLITDFDPQFVKAYRFGGYFLSGLTHDKKDYQKARDILRKGWDNNPDSWQIAYELGSVYNLSLKDPVSAAEWFGKAAQNPRCPNMVREHATVIYQEEGRLKKAWEMWAGVVKNAEDGSLREVAEWNKKRIESLILAGQLSSLVEKYKGERGTLPRVLADLREAGLLKSVPTDAFGENFLYVPSVDETNTEEFKIDSKELVRRVLNKRIRYLQRTVLSFKREHGRFPASVEELIGKGKRIKYMPHGIQPDYDPETGRFTYDKTLTKYNLGGDTPQ